jgi:Flp pilus assembly protein TadD
MRARSLFTSALLLACVAAPVGAQNAMQTGRGAGPATLAAPSESPSARQARLDRLFERLAAATDPEDAKRYESGIESLWQGSGSDTADLLTSRALELAAADDNDGALKLLGAALHVKPDYAEGWNKRATLFFLKGDYAGAMRGIRETIRHEPRHYGAWAALGRILEQSGDDRRALDAYRRAIAINPQMDGLRDEVLRLEVKVLGQET